MKLPTYSNRKKGFTLVELLVVIAIVAALAGLTFSVVMKQVDKAKIMKIKSVCTELANSVDTFYTDNNTYPVATYPKNGRSITTDLDDSSGIIAILLDRESGRSNRKVNKTGTKYLAGSLVDEKVDGIYMEGNKAGYYDLWGNPYYVLIDYDGRDEVDDPFTGRPVFNKRALVYSLGPNEMGSDVDGKAKDVDAVEDNICSWK